MTEQPRILCVCTHNRTRSVLFGSLLRHYTAASSLRPNIVDVGLGPPGLPVTDGVGHALAEYGIYVYSHLSIQVTDRIASEAHLVLCAERTQVVNVSTRARNMFARTFTFPEFVARATDAGPRGDRSVQEWVAEVDTGRRAAEYVHASIPMIEDPTGFGPAAMEESVAEIDDLCRRFAALWG